MRLPSRAPCACAASSSKIRPWASASVRRPAQGTGAPYRCTGMMARVRSVIAASTPAKLIFIVSGSASTGTTVAPVCATASQVAINVCAGTITSSPGPIPRARNGSTSASSPLPTPTQYFAPQYSAKAASNSATAAPPIYIPDSIKAP